MSIKSRLQKRLDLAVAAMSGSAGQVHLEQKQDSRFGDFATNIAMTLAKQLKRKPAEIAADIVKHLDDPTGLIAKTDIAGPGFLNITIKPGCWIDELQTIAHEKNKFGSSPDFSGKKALIEFVSANPTGPLHIGHGRGAVVGDGLARLLELAGYEVQREYYVNDGGIQMRNLGRSVLAHYKGFRGEVVPFPENGYQGEYIKELAGRVFAERAKYDHKTDEDLIDIFGQFAGDEILAEIAQDLKNIRIEFQTYFFESTLYKSGAVQDILSALKTRQASYEQDGATWLRSTTYHDDKDRVLVKNDGSYTYLTPDLAYHAQKFARGFDLYVNLWGADHGGYVQRLRAGLHALGLDETKLQVLLIQMVSLIRGGEQISMSTRRAQYETLQNIVEEVGPDVTRYFYLTRSHQAQLDFDLELAKKESSENPAYYIQYAHARICSVFRKWQGAEEYLEQWVDYDTAFADLLNLEEEVALAKTLLGFPEFIEHAATELAPHRVAHFALELARQFQSYYDSGRQDDRYRILDQPGKTSLAKLFLLNCVRQVLHNALNILGVSAPQRM